MVRSGARNSDGRSPAKRANTGAAVASSRQGKFYDNIYSNDCNSLLKGLSILNISKSLQNHLFQYSSSKPTFFKAYFKKCSASCENTLQLGSNKFTGENWFFRKSSLKRGMFVTTRVYMGIDWLPRFFLFWVINLCSWQTVMSYDGG